MLHLRFMAAAALTLSLAACQSPTATVPGTAAFAPEESIAVNAELRIDAPAAYRLANALTAYSAADIDHVTLTLLKFDAGTSTYKPISAGVTKTVAQAQLGNTVSLKGLRLDTKYKLTARAYADADATQAIDNVAQAGHDAACSTLFQTPAKTTNAQGVETVGAMASLTIPVKLADKFYNGQSSSSGVTPINGSIVNDPQASESF